MSCIDMVLNPKEKDLGDDFKVRRSLPQIQRRHIGPFVFWDHMGPTELFGEKEMKVRAHPHIGLATITYLFSGEIMHRDSLGNEQAIRPGEVNWMIAGKGIVHSERAQVVSEKMKLEGIQLWIALPTEYEEVDPSFIHMKESDLPIIEKEGISLRLIAGEAMGFKSPLPVYSDLFYLNGRAMPDSAFDFELKPTQEGALYIINGEIIFEGKTYERYQLVVFKTGAKVQFQCSSESEFMLFGGEAFIEKRHIWWNFVSSKQELIEQAKKDWKEGSFGHVVNENERIPLPDHL